MVKLRVRKRMVRNRYVDPRQLEFQFFFRGGQSYRATVLAVVNESNSWLPGRQIAQRAQMPYKRAVDALMALHNNGQVARRGRTMTAQWGALELDKPAEDNFGMLENLFRKIVAK